MPISRYHSAPSALAITALLHDHAASSSEEVKHPLTVSFCMFDDFCLIASRILYIYIYMKSLVIIIRTSSFAISY